MSKDVFVSKMEERELQFEDEHGILRTMPIIGMFSLKEQYYIVLFDESDDKEQQGELIMLKADTVDGHDCVQLITDKEEWDEAKETWDAIIDEAERKGIV